MMTTRSWECAATWTPPADARHVAVSPAMTRAAVLAADGTVLVVDTQTGTTTARLRVVDAAWLAVSDDGAAVAVIDAARRVRVIPVGAPADARALAVRCGARCTMACDSHVFRDDTLVEPDQLVFSPRGDLVIASERSFDDHETYYGGGTIRGDAETWVARCSTGVATLLAASRVSGSITYSYSTRVVPPAHAVAAVCSRHAGWLALVFDTGGVTVHRRLEDAWSVAPRPPHDEVRAAAFTPDEAILLLARGMRVVRWELERGEESGALVTAGEVLALAHAPGDPRIACVDQNGEVTIHGDASADPLPRAHPSPAARVSWSAGLLRIRCADGTVVSWSDAVDPRP